MREQSDTGKEWYRDKHSLAQTQEENEFQLQTDVPKHNCPKKKPGIDLSGERLQRIQCQRCFVVKLFLAYILIAVQNKPIALAA
jgi:hypothetical protein